MGGKFGATAVDIVSHKIVLLFSLVAYLVEHARWPSRLLRSFTGTCVLCKGGRVRWGY